MNDDTDIVNRIFIAVILVCFVFLIVVVEPTGGVPAW